jgi:hypothetical protein
MLKKSTEGKNALKTKKKVKVEDLFSVGGAGGETTKNHMDSDMNVMALG